MYGFEAISHYNGWAMALIGALIVVSGLSMLCLIISQFQRLSVLLEKPRKETPPPPVQEESPRITAPDRCPLNIGAMADIYRELSDSLGNEFHLSELYQLSQENNFPHPHLTIKCLREAELLVSKGEGRFTWNN